MIWDGNASTANEFFGENYGNDWVYVGEGRAIQVKDFNCEDGEGNFTGEMLTIEVGDEVTKAHDGFITVKKPKKHCVLAMQLSEEQKARIWEAASYMKGNCRVSATLRFLQAFPEVFTDAAIEDFKAEAIAQGRAMIKAAGYKKEGE